MKNRLSFFILIFCIIIFPVSINAQQDQTNLEDIKKELVILENQNIERNEEIIQQIDEVKERSDNLKNELSSMQSEIIKTNNDIQDILNKINKQLQENQSQDEKVQFLYTIAQVTGVFVAIILGFFTTKVLSLSTEKNRISRRIKEIDSELENKKTIVERYQNIVDNISYRWARTEVNKFTNKLLSSAGLKEFSIEEIIQRFTEETDNNPPNEYEEDLLREDYEQILDSIRKKIEENKKSSQRSTLDMLSSFGSIPNYLADITSFNDYSKETISRYQDADEKLKLEQAEETHLKTEKDNLAKELEDIAIPTSAKRGILFSFIAIILGVIIPLYLTFINYVTQNSLVIGFVCFLSSLIVMYYYFGFELRSQIIKPK